MLPVTVSFTPTQSEWREALRVCRLDQRSNRLCTAFFAVLFYVIFRYGFLPLIPGDHDSWDLGLGLLMAAAFLIVDRIGRIGRRRMATRRAATAAPLGRRSRGQR